jgi:hypothetical protein
MKTKVLVRSMVELIQYFLTSSYIQDGGFSPAMLVQRPSESPKYSEFHIIHFFTQYPKFIKPCGLTLLAGISITHRDLSISTSLTFFSYFSGTIQNFHLSLLALDSTLENTEESLELSLCTLRHKIVFVSMFFQDFSLINRKYI